jgi:type VI secretion system secreted protein Hcp
MPIDSNGSAASAADLFLHVQTKRAGKVKGEANTQGHVDDIELIGWRWGAQAGSAIGSTATTARRQYQPLVVLKRIDSASTGLLSALATNDEVKEAKLTMRKAGGETLDYLRITLAGARVTDVDVEVDARGVPVEKVVIAFTKVDIEYQRQTSAGASAGAFTFSDEVLPK